MKPSSWSVKKQKKEKSDEELILESLRPPKNAETATYDLKEVITFMRVDQESPIFGMTIAAVYRLLVEERKRRLMVCSCKTLQRAVKQYVEEGVMPEEGDEGIQVGRPARVSLHKVGELNENVHVHVGKAESVSDLSKALILRETESRRIRGLDDAPVPAPSRNTVKTHNLLSANEPGVTLTMLSSTRSQGARRQMAAEYPRNRLVLAASITLAMLQRRPAGELETFVWIRKFSDITETWWVPNKGTAATAHLSCNKTKGPLLIKMAYESRQIALIGKIPDLPPVEIPPVLRPKPSVVEFSTMQQLESFDASEEYCRRIYESVVSINLLGIDVLQSHVNDMTAHNKKAELFASKVLGRLPSFVIPRIPSEKEELLPGTHWVWSSFASKLRRMSTMMVLANVVGEGLECRGPDEGLLATPNVFQHAVGPLATSDGIYAVEDMIRNVIFRMGMTIAGMNSCWQGSSGHEENSKLRNPKTCNKTFYNLYPHESVAHEVKSWKGTFQDLNQLVGIGFDVSKAKAIVELFDFKEFELEALKRLKMPSGRDSLVHRQYKHIICLFETAFAMSVEPRRNVSSNPTCEWQLRYYGEEGS